MRRQLPWTLLLLLALCVTSCGPLRSSNRDSRGDDDDDDSADDDDDDDAVSDDDDAVSDDDDFSDDDDAVSDDDDFSDDDDATEPLGTVSGTWVLYYNFGPAFEKDGFQDCDLGRSVNDQSYSPPSGCPSCSYEWTVNLLYSSSDTTCDLAYFGGSPPDDLIGLGMGLSGSTYYEYFGEGWYEGMTGSFGGSASSGYFYGSSDPFPASDGSDYTFTVLVDIDWN